MSKIYKMKAIAGAKLYNFLHNEKGAVDIVAIVVLIGIAVLLAIIFKDAISDLIKGLIAKIKSNADATVTTP